MSRLLGTILCIFTLGMTSLSIAQGHGATPTTAHGTMTKAHQHADAEHMGSHADKAGMDSQPGMEQCEMLPGHCTILTLTHDTGFGRVHYGSADLSVGFDDRRKSKFRPEIEPRPPRV